AARRGSAPREGSDRALADDAAKAEVGSGGVDGLRLPGRGSVAPAEIRRAEVGASLDHLARDADGRVEALALAAAPRIAGNAAGLRLLGRVARPVPVGGPLPDVADHVHEAVAVRWERADGRGSAPAVALEV